MENIILTIIIGIIIGEYALTKSLDYLNQKNWSPNLPEKFKSFYDEVKGGKRKK